MENLRRTASSGFLNAIEAVGFNRHTIPDFSAVNRILGGLTGWSLTVVPNISPQKEFFEFLNQRRFTATCWLRSMQELDYLEEPDMFHDVFGHVPLLSDRHYTDFFKGISEIALRHIDNPLAIELLGRIYWFTIEFGLIREGSEAKIYGAGIISSSGETQNAMSDASIKKAFDVRTLMETSFRTDTIQPLYFVIESFEQLYRSLPEIERILEERIANSK